MRSCDVHYYLPDQLCIWRGATDKWVGEGNFKDLKAEITDMGYYYEDHHCVFEIEADDRCVYIKVVSCDPDTEFNRTIGVKVSWDNGRLYFPLPSISWEEPHNDSHRIHSSAIKDYFDEDITGFKNEDGTYNVDAIVDKIWNYYKGKETTSYWTNEDWHWMSGEEFKERICGVWDEVPQLIKDFVERRLSNDRG